VLIKMVKRLLAALLVAGIVFTLAACNKDDAKTPDVKPDDNPVVQPDTLETPTDDADIDYDAVLSKERYDGYNYRVLVRKGHLKTQYLEDGSEDIVDDAVYRRNMAVEEKYGIKITASESSSNNFDTDALNSILAGDDAYDVIFAHSRAAFAYAVQGAAFNIHDISTIHPDMPWWSKNINDNCTVGGRLFVLDGDISVAGLSNAMCLLFNKRIFDEKGFDYPYEMVKDGDWTFDEFAYLAKKGGDDLNGDGVMNPEDDRFGFVTAEWEAPINILYTGGQRIYGINDEGAAELTLYSNKTVEIFDEFFSLMNNEACFLQFYEGNVNYSGPNLFESGRAMIATGSLGSAQGFRNMDDDFGIIPYPKFDEMDEYATIINGFAPLVVIPISVSDVNRTGAITEALAAYGHRDVIPAFYEKSLKSKYARDEESEEMMDIIKDSIVYDIGYVSGGTFQSVGHSLAVSPSRDFRRTMRQEKARPKKVSKNSTRITADFNKSFPCT